MRNPLLYDAASAALWLRYSDWYYSVLNERSANCYKILDIGLSVLEIASFV